MKSLEKANCLLKANFSTKEISIASGQGVRMVYQRKSVICQKLGMEEKGDIVETTEKVPLIKIEEWYVSNIWICTILFVSLW